jgi:site-specific recombinase XerD
MKIVLEPFKHREVDSIAIRFRYDYKLKEFLKRFKGMRWSASNRCFYVPNEPTTLLKLSEYIQLGGYFLDNGAFKYSARQITHTIKRDVLLAPIKPHNIPVYKNFIKYLEGKRYSKSTVSVYGAFVHEFLQFTGSKPTDLLTEDDVRHYIEWAVEALNYSISTHRQMVGAMKQFAFFYPACDIDVEKIYRPQKDKKLPVVMSKEEVIRLLQVIRNLKHRTAIALMYSSGLRIGEVINLELNCFDLERKQLHIKNGKGRSDRLVVIADSFIPLFKNYYYTYNPKVFFIENPRGGKYNAGSLRQVFKKNCKLAGITKAVTPHSLRHSYATHLLENGTDLRYIQTLLGHSRPETTMIYTHVAQKDLQAIQSPLDTTLMAMTARDNEDSNRLLSESIYGIRSIK